MDTLNLSIFEDEGVTYCLAIPKIPLIYIGHSTKTAFERFSNKQNGHICRAINLQNVRAHHHHPSPLHSLMAHWGVKPKDIYLKHITCFVLQMLLKKSMELQTWIY